MILFMIMPILIGGFGNILLPSMLCLSDMIFPRLNALSPRLIILSLIIILLSILIEGGINTGQTFYVPLSIINNNNIIFILTLHSNLFNIIDFIYIICLLFILT